MIPGVVSSRVQHGVDCPTSFSHGRPSGGGVRIFKIIATNGNTIAMLGHTTSTDKTNNVNVYYTTDYGRTWSQTPGTIPSVTGWVSGDNNLGGILYDGTNWITVFGDANIRYSTDLSANWSTWNLSTQNSTDRNHGPIFYTTQVSPNYVLVNTVNGGITRVGNSLSSIALSTLGNTRNTPEDLCVGKLGGTWYWVTISTGNIDIFTGGTSTAMGTRVAKTGTANSMRSLIYWEEKGLWIMGSSNAELVTSPDTGTDFVWTSRSNPSADDVTSLAIIPGVGAIAGTSPTANTAAANELGTIMFSKDGITWTQLTGFNDSTAAYGYGYYPINYNGALLYPRPENASGPTPTTTADGLRYKTILIADR
jgi:hypothetical protein